MFYEHYQQKRSEDWVDMSGIGPVSSEPISDYRF